MLRGLAILSIILAVWYYIDKTRGRLPPDIEIESLREFRHVSPEHYERAMENARYFEQERIGSTSTSKMSVYTARILENLNEILMRLPNDATRRDRLESLIEHTEAILQQDMEDVHGYGLSPSPFPFRQYYFRNSGVAPLMLTPKPVQV